MAMKTGRYDGCQDDWGKVSQKIWDACRPSYSGFWNRDLSTPLGTALENWHWWDNDADVLALASQVLNEVTCEVNNDE